VRPGSAFHQTEYFGPILGIMHAKSLSQAIEWQNATDYGLTAGLHSLDSREVNTWIDKVEAGNLYVNRGTTGAIVQRQPFGGWKRSSVGTTAKAGGPNYLTHLGTWQPRPLRHTGDAPELSEPVQSVLNAALTHVTPAERTQLFAAAGSDEIAWTREYGVMKDVSGLGVERNVFRYVATPVTIRFDGFLFELIRVLLAAARAGAPVVVSSRMPVPDGLVRRPRIETHDSWMEYVARTRPDRIRLVGGSAKEIAVAVDGDPDVAIYADPVTMSGRVEMLPFVREQAISITNHRFGNHDAEFEWVLPRPT
jgi:RHH-type proline utilization regulon transcriptional repressor/proline dehydrogenase/delta 1-pyrroline-5-carboxylate dehydrogenase